MRTHTLAWFAALSAPVAAQDSPTAATAFVGGLWFDGERFQPGTRYAVAGVLRTRRPKHVESTIDLGGGFVVPPYGEAHNHNLEPIVWRGRDLDAKIRAYITAGVWYVKVPGSGHLDEVRAALARHDVVDAVFSGGAALTTAGGHPEPQIRRVMAAGNIAADAGEGVSFFTIDSFEELEAKWPRVVATEPDFVKTFLLHTGEDQPPTPGWQGLRPEILAEIVKRARDAKLSVAAHVETAADFRAAVAAGVDEINHMPGFRPDWSQPLAQYRLRAEDAAAAAAAGTAVVTTLYRGSRTFRNRPGTLPIAAARDRYRTLQRHNLALIHAHGVRVTVGTDQYDQISTVEARWLASLDVFTNAEMLTMLCEITPRSIFPDRAIGRLEDGYEASFLVLARDPLEGFDRIDDIEIRVRQGRRLRE